MRRNPCHRLPAFLGSALVAALLLVLPAHAADTVRLQLKWKHQFQFAGYYAAVHKGIYQKHGLVVQLLEASEHQAPAQVVYSGGAHFGVATTDVLLNVPSGKHPVILASVFQHSPQVLIARKNSDIHHVHHLAGKRVMMEPHAVDLITYMADEGIDIGEISVAPHTFHPQKLIDSSVDAMSAYLTDEPFLLEQASVEYTVISPLSGGIDFYGDVLFTTAELMEKNPDLVRRFRAASLEGWQYAMQNADEMIGVIHSSYSRRHSVEHLRYEAEMMRRYVLDNVVEIGYSNRGRWDRIIELYKKLGFLEQGYSPEKLIFEDYRPSAKPVNWLLLLAVSAVAAVASVAFFFFFKLSSSLKKEVAKQHRLRAELEEREAKYRFITDNMIDVIWTLDVETLTYRYISPSIERLGGIHPDVFLTIPFGTGMPPESLEDIKKIIVERVAALNNSPGEKKYYTDILQQARGDGMLVWTEVLTHYLVNPRTNAIEVHGVTRDITRRLEAEKELRSREHTFRTLVETAPCGIFALDDTKILMVNPAFCDMLGYSQDEILTMNALHFVHLEDIDRVNVGLIGLRNNSSPQLRFECRVCTKEGHIRWLDMTMAPTGLYGEDVLLCSVFDVTESRNLHKELQELNSTKDTLFSIIAHDLKNPISNMKQVTSLLLESYDDLSEGERRQFVESVKDSAGAVFTLLENLLEWSRSQRGLLQYNPVPMDLRIVALNTVSILRLSAENKAIELINDVTEEVMAYGDPALLTTVLRNLCSNAIKFTPRGGKVVVDAVLKDDLIQLSVSDTGVGISADAIADIFNPMGSKSTPGTERESGTGLGLVICREFAEKNGGTIWAESTPGKGSTFFFTVPAASESTLADLRR